MKKTKFLCTLTALALTLSIALTIGNSKVHTVSAAENTETASQKYVEAMGHGWNLGNTLEAINWGDPASSNESTWGQPVVTQEFMVALKAKGFNSIRIPFSATPGYTQDKNGHYIIDQTRLKRYKQVVDWAVAAGLYVQVDFHDATTFINNDKWHGGKSQVPFLKFTDFWTQLVDTFKAEPNQVCFETFNEPDFQDEKDSAGNVTIIAQDKLNMINQAAYDIVRHSGGSNATRMIIIPSMRTNYSTTEAAYNWISSKKDPNLIATVHWYSEWYYGVNIGKTGFDEELYPDRPGFTPRSADQVFFDAINNNLITKGVGVIIGEYGLGINDPQMGEAVKYYEDMNYKSNHYKTCLMLWDCGILNRNDMTWNQPLLGNVVDAAIKGQRSSYATGLDEIYLSKSVDNDVQIPLTLNGNTFIGIDGLTTGTDYTYDAATATVTLFKAYVNSKFNALGAGQYGSIADLVLKFSAGDDWVQHLIKYSSPMLKSSTGTTSGVNIPVEFNGTKLRRAHAVMLNDDGTDGKAVGQCSGWWPWLVWGDNSEFHPDYNNKTINIESGFLQNGSIPANGNIKFTFEFYDGQTVNYILTRPGFKVTGYQPTDKIPTKGILELFNRKDSIVVVNLTKPDTISKDIFTAIQRKDINVTFNLENEKGEKVVSWTFNGLDIKGNIKPIDLTANFKAPEGVQKGIDSLIKNSSSAVITFASNGVLPGKAHIKVYVGDKFTTGDGINVYYYNESTHKAETISNKLKVDKDGFVEFDITHCSTYFTTKETIKDAVNNNKNNDTVTWQIASAVLVMMLFISSGIIIWKRRYQRNSSRGWK